MSSTFGELFRITTFGESHGGGVGVVIDGMPPGFTVDLAAIQLEPKEPLYHYQLGTLLVEARDAFLKGDIKSVSFLDRVAA